MFLLCSCVYLSFRFGIHLYGFFASLKKKSPSIYNFGGVVWFTSGEENNGKGDM
jgi:hypothetical protein